MEATTLPGVTLDERDEAELEAAFGVVSNAEELVRTNRGRYTTEHRATLNKGENPQLTGAINETDEDGNILGLKSDAAEAIEDKVGFPVETAVVRGVGRNAQISFTYVGPRGSIEKDIIAYTSVFGSAAEKRAAKRRGRAADPDDAAQQAADETLAEAEREAAEKLREAQEEAQAALDKAREDAEKVLADAQEEAAKVRAKAAEEAPKDADKAKRAAARSGSSGSSGSRSKSSRSRSR
jgi:vacuolar-type H+-ATPase subunit H